MDNYNSHNWDSNECESILVIFFLMLFQCPHWLPQLWIKMFIKYWQYFEDICKHFLWLSFRCSLNLSASRLPDCPMYFKLHLLTYFSVNEVLRCAGKCVFLLKVFPGTVLDSIWIRYFTFKTNISRTFRCANYETTLGRRLGKVKSLRFVSQR